MAWFWNSRNYEKDIQSLTVKTRTARAALRRRENALVRLPRMLALQSGLLYLTFLAYAAYTQRFWESNYAAAALLIPVTIYGSVRLLRAGLNQLVLSGRKTLQKVTVRRDNLVKEYKKKTDFDNIKKVIDEAEAPDDVDKAKKQTDVPLRRQKDNTAERRNINASGNSQPRQLGSPARLAPGGSTATNFHDNRAPMGETGKTLPLNPPVVSGGQFVPPAVEPRSPFSARAGLDMPPAGPAQHTWVDRVLDFILGENETAASNRYALICSNCHSHNGLAPFGESPATIVYRCPVCGYWNGPRDKPRDEKALTPVATTAELGAPEEILIDLEGSDHKRVEETGDFDSATSSRQGSAESPPRGGEVPEMEKTGRSTTRVDDAP